MKTQVTTFGLAGIALIILTSLSPSLASATTFETTGVTENGEVTITSSTKSGHSVVIKDTAGFSSNTCTSEHWHGRTVSYTPKPRLPIFSYAMSNCTRPITVHAPGELEFEYISGTTNATVISVGAEITVGSPIGTLTCKTGAGTDMGTLTGVASGDASVDVNAVINCGIIPSAKWESTWTITGPHGLGVTA